MLPFFPKQIASKAITIYLAALAVVSIVFYRYAMQFSFMALGVVEVAGFFYLSNSCSKAWSRVPVKVFVKNVFWTALALRVAWVLFSYFFYIHLTGQPFEPGAAGCFFEKVQAPTITDEGLYDFSNKGRDIVVYTRVDTRLLFGDMESRFRLTVKE